MRKRFLTTLLLTATALATIGCQDESSLDGEFTDDSLPQEQGCEEGVTFTASITRAGDTSFELSDAISVSAYNQSAELYASNVEYVYSANKIFESTTPITLSDGNSKLTYYALYPYAELNSKSVSFCVESNQSVGDNYTLSDLMWGYTSLSTSTSPSLTFNRLMSKVVLSIIYTDVEMINVTATINAVASTTITLPSKISTLGTDSKEITMASNGVNSYMAIIPAQTFAVGSVIATIDINGVKYDITSSSEQSFEMGKEYTFNLNITDGSITIS